MLEEQGFVYEELINRLIYESEGGDIFSDKKFCDICKELDIDSDLACEFYIRLASCEGYVFTE